ncbi:hypothetical protein Daus18300_013840 [Diaporthe australafricana]|uniref:F-box domain-containing protein n=1 Tax=Diaporthe australafricana TaxID=127596 RepID=A0ABR3VXV4_9PEZI
MADDQQEGLDTVEKNIMGRSITSEILAKKSRPSINPDTIQEKPDTFNFLGLPGEIRNKIYRYALQDDNFIQTLAPPALTLTNKSIRAEALPLYYSQNVFYLLLCGEEAEGSYPDPHHFLRFRRMMECLAMRKVSSTDQGPQQYIRNLVVQFDAPEYYSMCIFDGGRQDFDLRDESWPADFETLPFDHTRFRWTVKSIPDLDNDFILPLRLVEYILDMRRRMEGWAQGSLQNAIGNLLCGL